MTEHESTDGNKQTDQPKSYDKVAAETVAQLVAAFADEPERLERLYHEVVADGQTSAFRKAIANSRTSAPGNRLFAAWYFRLEYVAVEVSAWAVNWGWAIPLAILNGLLFWWLSADEFMLEFIGGERLNNTYTTFAPIIVLLGAPLSATMILSYLSLMRQKGWRTAILIIGSSLITAAYVVVTYRQTGTRTFQEQYLILAVIHIPVVALAGVGIYLLHSDRDHASRFAFLMKSVEVFIMGGLFAGAGGIFMGITFALFDALGVEFATNLIRLLTVGGLGLLPVVAVALTYNPMLSPGEQAFRDGLGKLVALIMRLLLPLTFLVLLVYLIFIPFNFREPFDNRDVLFIFNAMLFGVIALIVGATPFTKVDLSPRSMRYLRYGIIGVAALAFLVSVYASAAIIYRMNIDRMTPNRLAVLGWNLLNTTGLLVLLIQQLRVGTGRWLQSLYHTFSIGTIAYTAWAIILLAAIPWLFGINQGDVESLPLNIQTIVFEIPEPILLKCNGIPHIYLLEDGEKRWIADIQTFSAQGYLWRDVNFVSCDSLRLVPVGESIPEGAGEPPGP